MRRPRDQGCGKSGGTPKRSTRNALCSVSIDIEICDGFHRCRLRGAINERTPSSTCFLELGSGSHDGCGQLGEDHIWLMLKAVCLNIACWGVWQTGGTSESVTCLSKLLLTHAGVPPKSPHPPNNEALSSKNNVFEKVLPFPASSIHTRLNLNCSTPQTNEIHEICQLWGATFG